MLFDFMLAAPYEDRKVARYEKGDMVVSTAAAPDSSHPFETAIEHPAYNEGEWVIVEEYDDRDAALTGHDKWVKTMMAPALPGELRNVSTAEVARFCKALRGDGEGNDE